MKTYLSLILAVFSALTSYSQVAVFNTLAEMDSRPPSQANPLSIVLGYDETNRMGWPKSFRYDPTNTLPVTEINRAVGFGRPGRRVNDWEGDLAAFGVFPSESDVSSRLNPALAFAASNNVVAKILIPGRYIVTNSVEIPSNCKFEMHPEAVFIRQIPSSTADALPQEATVRNSGVTGWQTMGELSLVNSNITLTGIRCRTESTNFFGFHVFMQGVSDLTIERPHIERSYRAWAMTIAASNAVVNLPMIRNGGEDGSYVYQDGIHITGGENIRIIGPDIVSGDDSIGLGQHSMPIRNVVVIGGNLVSTHAQNIRGFIGYDFATNLIERVGIYNVTGSSGYRNATIQTGTASTNVSRPFRNWTIDGAFAVTKQSGTNPVAFDAGFVIRNFDGIRLKNASVQFSVEPNLLILDCDNAVVENCTFGGTGWTLYNQSVRIERSSNVQLLRNSIINSNTNSAYGVYILNSSGTLLSGNTFDTAYSCASLAGTNSGTITFKHNKFKATNSLQRALVVNQLPTNLVFVLNEIDAATTPAFPSIRYATVTVTNTPISGNSIAINFNSRAFSTSLTSTSFPPAASISDAVSNIVAALAAYPEPWVSVAQTASNKFVLSSMPGSELYCSTLGGWADVSFANSSGIIPDNYVIDMNFGWPNPNTDRHYRTDNFGPHVRFVQATELSTNSIYSSNDRFRLKNEEQSKFYASWDLSGSTVFHTLGDSSGSATPIGYIIQGESGSGTNIATGVITVRPGRSTGTATPPPMVFQVYSNAGFTNSSSVGHTAIDAIRLATTNMIAGQAVARLGYWTGGFFNQGRLVRTNIGGVNYWIDP